MKKLLTVFLLLAMILGMCACGEGAGGGTTEPADPLAGKFSVGYAKTNITPNGDLILGSHAARESTGFLEYLEAISVAVTDAEGDTLILVVTDLSWGSIAYVEEIRKDVEKKWGIPGDNVIIGGTHNHNAPDVGNSDSRNVEYMTLWHERVLEAIGASLEDRKPAQMYITETATDNLTFSRRYWMEYEGETLLRGDNYNLDLKGKIIGHETEADQEMQLVKFVREGGKDIIMMNWQSHAHKLGWSTQISTDYPGPFRDAVEKELDCHAVFYQGACGNLNPRSEIEGEDTFSVGQYKELGQELAKYVVAAKDSFVQVETGNVQTTQFTYAGKINRSDPERLVWAQDVSAYYVANGKDNSKALKYAREKGYDIYGYMESSAINYRYNLGAEQSIELNIMSIGDVSFITLPVEFFDTLGMNIKEATPFEMTVIMGYTCGIGRYVPTLEGYANKGYESYNSIFEPGVSEDCEEIYLEKLNELYKTK